MFLAFLGCDGSGKSAVVSELKDRLEASGTQVICGHWRPKAFTNKFNENGLANAVDPHGQASRDILSSFAKLGWLWLNWWVGWWLVLRRARRDGFVLFDRFHGDILVDPKRYRFGAPMWAAKQATKFMPQPDLIFFLDAESNVLLSRKQEVSKDALELSRSKYLALCNTSSRFRVIDASQSLSKVVDDIIEQIPK